LPEVDLLTAPEKKDPAQKRAFFVNILEERWENWDRGRGRPPQRE
jgi:hypothetical protein